MTIRTLPMAALAALAIAPMARAQTAPAPNQAPPVNQVTPAKGAVDDSLFVAAAATGGQAEVALSELGLQRATAPELKSISQKMIDDHTRTNAQLAALAAQKRIPVPRGVDARSLFCHQSLAGLQRDDFEKCYAKAQYITHLETIAMFEAEAERGRDPDLRAFAARTLPHLKDHLKAIKPIAMKYMKEKEKENDETKANITPPE